MISMTSGKYTKQSKNELVLELLRKIPEKKVSTYASIAKKAGLHPRAVAVILSKNKNLDEHPCYKVVYSSGHIGGYNAGVRNKIKRLTGNNSSDFVLSEVTNNIGCIASDSIIEIGGDILFLASDGIRPIQGTARIGDIELQTVSKPIQQILQALPQN